MESLKSLLAEIKSFKKKHIEAIKLFFETKSKAQSIPENIWPRNFLYRIPIGRFAGLEFTRLRMFSKQLFSRTFVRGSLCNYQ